MKIGDAGNSLIADTDNCDVLARIFGSSELTTSWLIRRTSNRSTG
ncbi:hypothetical protein SFC43_27615 [Bacteroides sp. CR5/BHMF/2]|nr:hypothetical protein [Bacteroides sp. CR5/BHMF/2]